tara:strand:+ start:849 stop:1178 length:330 start_codon:yes stop_codon:yes gene_type:complete
MKPFNIISMFFVVLVIVIVYSMFNPALSHTMESGCVIQKIYTPDKEKLLETTMVCRDGNIGPSYWELFAEFYYGGVSEQEYCRYVKGENIFGLPEKVCLNEDGTWRYHD